MMTAITRISSRAFDAVSLSRHVCLTLQWYDFPVYSVLPDSLARPYLATLLRHAREKLCGCCEHVGRLSPSLWALTMMTRRLWSSLIEQGGPLPWVGPILLVLLVCDLSRAINSIGVYRKREDSKWHLKQGFVGSSINPLLLTHDPNMIFRPNPTQSSQLLLLFHSVCFLYSKLRVHLSCFMKLSLLGIY